MTVRPARMDDAAGIGAVHVASWRSTYAGILPEKYLAGMSVNRQASGYERMMRWGTGVFVAEMDRQVVGFTTTMRIMGNKLGDGEIQTLYVLDDFRDLGLGRALMRAAGGYLAARNCTRAFAWVLCENPAVFFYERIGGKRAATGEVYTAGVKIPQAAYVWNPIARLLEAAPGGAEA